MSNLIAFIGVGNMGCPMAENLMKAGKTVKVFDVSKKMLEIAKDKNYRDCWNYYFCYWGYNPFII